MRCRQTAWRRSASAALAASGDVATHLSARNVAGVRVVDLGHEPVARPRTGRGYDLLATTPHVDAAAAGFERQLDRLLDVAATELSLRRLAAEITRTTRRVNALDHVVIPRLERERDAIQAVLDERESSKTASGCGARARPAGGGHRRHGRRNDVPRRGGRPRVGARPGARARDGERRAADADGRVERARDEADAILAAARGRARGWLRNARARSRPRPRRTRGR